MKRTANRPLRPRGRREEERPVLSFSFHSSFLMANQPANERRVRKKRRLMPKKKMKKKKKAK